jgi:thiamine monophosphate synthase
MVPIQLHGLYLILDPRFVQRLTLVDALKEAAAGGATLFQYRDKTASASCRTIAPGGQ